MRAFFGIWDFEGGPVDPFLLARASLLVRQFAGSKAAIVQRRSLALISETDTPDQKPAPAAPQDAPAAPALLWSGRLDNRAELAALSGARPDSLTDEQAIELAYARGGSDVFSRILGDWALAVVHEPERQLILGRDFAGVRSLFYRTHAATVVWSTHLAPLVLLEETIPALSEEYLAGWLSFFPEGHLTPYRDILAVPPASFVRITPNGTTSRKYWGLDSAKPLRYRTDRDYEEHFLSVFRESVARRLKSEAPLLAELSGGVDSSSIVCIADRLLAMGAVTSRLDTVTYFDSEEPTWDELPFAAKVEEQRGRIGHHIDVGPAQSVSRDEFAGGFSAVPGPIAERSPAAKAFDRIVSENGYAVVLSEACPRPCRNWLTCWPASALFNSSGARSVGRLPNESPSSDCGIACWHIFCRAATGKAPSSNTTGAGLRPTSAHATSPAWELSRPASASSARSRACRQTRPP